MPAKLLPVLGLAAHPIKQPPVAIVRQPDRWTPGHVVVSYAAPFEPVAAQVIVEGPLLHRGSRLLHETAVVGNFMSWRGHGYNDPEALDSAARAWLDEGFERIRITIDDQPVGFLLRREADHAVAFTEWQGNGVTVLLQGIDPDGIALVTTGLEESTPSPFRVEDRAM